VNGEVDGQTALGGFAHVPSTSPVHIGERFSDSDVGEWTGAIDGLRISNRALDPAELAHGPATTWSLGAVSGPAIEDDFEDGAFAAGWLVINGQWEEVDGRMTAGSGGQADAAELRSRTAVDPGDSAVRLSYDFLLNSSGAGSSWSGVFLEDDQGFVYGGDQNAYGRDWFHIYHARGQHFDPPEEHPAVGRAYRVELTFDGADGVRYTYTRLDTGAVVLDGANVEVDASLPEDAGPLHVVFEAHNAGQWFDNVEVELLP